MIDKQCALAQPAQHLADFIAALLFPQNQRSHRWCVDFIEVVVFQSVAKFTDVTLGDAEPVGHQVIEQMLSGDISHNGTKVHVCASYQNRL